MKEDQVYSIHSKKSSQPQKIGSDSNSDAISPSAGLVSAVTPQEPQVPDLPPLPLETSLPPTPIPPPAPEAPSPSEAEQSQIERERAVAMAQSKINALYGEEALAAEPGQVDQIAQGYATEQIIQTEIDPTHAPSQPDHQLPPPQPEQKYAEQAPITESPSPEQYAPQPTAKKHIDKIKDKIKKSGVKEKANAHIAKARNLKNKIKQAPKNKPAAPTENKKKSIWRRLAPAASLVLVITLILNNQLVYGQISYYVTPGDRIERPTIVESEAGNQAPPGDRIIIPKINVDVPINNNVKTYDEDAIQRGLEDGIVHYAKTGMPGEVGNNVLLGHNTNNFWNSGKYKTAFVLLDRLKEGDTFEIHHKEKRYVYTVYKKKIIQPDDFSVVTQKVTEPIVTLITCHPPGTSWERLIIQARQISPEPAKSDTTIGNEIPQAEGDVPGAAPGPLEDLFGWIF